MPCLAGKQAGRFIGDDLFMRIGGMLKFTMIDFPGKVSAVIFTQGCNLRCAYCHNRELIPADKPALMTEDAVLTFLKKRQKALDGVTITGGEPTLQSDLPDFIAKIKSLGFAVKLDTNGTNPDMLEALLKANMLDYAAMDIKAPFGKYEAVCGPVDLEKVKRSISLLKASSIAYEFRTTYYKKVLNDADIEEIKAMLNTPLKVQECLPVPDHKDTLKIES